jgi:hypothetical protein
MDAGRWSIGPGSHVASVKDRNKKGRLQGSFITGNHPESCRPFGATNKLKRVGPPAINQGNPNADARARNGAGAAHRRGATVKDVAQTYTMAGLGLTDGRSRKRMANAGDICGAS